MELDRFDKVVISGIAGMVISMVVVVLLVIFNDSGSDCLKSHTTVTYVPVYNPTTKTTSVKPSYGVECDGYAKK
jgi:hypothetical protein